MLLATALMQSARAASPDLPAQGPGVKPLEQVLSGQPLAQVPAAPAPVPQPVMPLNQSLSIAAGTGVLLHLSQPAATVLSADPTIARVQPASPTSLFLMGVAPGQTTVIATNQAGVAIVQDNIRVTPGAGRPATAGIPQVAPAPSGPAMVSAATARAIEGSIAQSVTGAQGVRVRATGTEVTLTGTVPNAMAAQQANAIARAYIGEKASVIDQLMVLGGIQVNVQVRIAEIDRQITRQLGINWQALGTIGSIGRLPATTLNLPGTVAGTTGTLATAACAASMLGGPVGIPLSVQCQGINFNGIIDALAQDQLATLLAEPNLTVLSGETASFLAGGEFPVPVAGNGNNGSTTITVEYKAFGVSLVMIPTVLSPTRLNLRVRPEVSQLSQNGAINIPLAGGTLTIPALTVRRAETTIELGSGQSFAIAGLLQRTSVNADNALPGLGELPVLGALFKLKHPDFAEETLNHQRGECVTSLRWSPTFLVEDFRDRCMALPSTPQLGCTGGQLVVSAELVETSNRSNQLVRGLVATVPMTAHADLLRAVDDFNQHPFEQQANQGLSLFLSGGCPDAG